METDVVKILSIIFGSLSSITAIVTLFVYKRQEKRIKNSAAVETEVRTLRAALEQMERQVSWALEQLGITQTLVTQKDAYIEQLTKELHVLEVKHSRNKSAINEAYSCVFCEGKMNLCPVIIRRAKNEEEYTKRLVEKEKGGN